MAIFPKIHTLLETKADVLGAANPGSGLEDGSYKD
jgi:hypothetical protein